MAEHPPPQAASPLGTHRACLSVPKLSSPIPGPSDDGGALVGPRAGSPLPRWEVIQAALRVQGAWETLMSPLS